MPDSSLLTASALLFIAGIYMTGRKQRGSAEKLLTFSLVCMYFLITTLYFVSDYFTGKGFNESVLYHLYYGVQGAGFSEYTGIILVSFFFIGPRRSPLTEINILEYLFRAGEVQIHDFPAVVIHVE